jgi:predicted DsbA family dithiol-disulfide isomerase
VTAPVRLIVWSDYLCPWCYVGGVRLRTLEDEGLVRLEWRSFLLRPRPDPGRTLEKFRAYTESWRRPAAEPDAPAFRVWEGDAGPPSHSIPPHLVAKAAATLGEDAFHRMHDRLMRAYFGENRDITDLDTLRALWGEVNLPDGEFGRAGDPAILRTVADEHNAALDRGISGVPTVSVEGREGFVPGAQPVETYRRWLARL